MASIKRRRLKCGDYRYDARLRVDGRPITRTFRRRADAERWAKAVELDSEDAAHIVRRPSKVTLAEFVPRFFAGRTLALTTEALYRDLFRRMIAPTFGDVQIRRITTEAVRIWHADVSRKITPLQASKAYRLLHTILNQAIEAEIIRRNPCAVPNAGKEMSVERPLAEPDVILALADAIDRRYRALVLLAAVGALRLGELLGLTRRMVTVGNVRVEQQALQIVGHGRVITLPKRSPIGVRTVAVPDFVVEAIEEHLAEFAAPGPDGAVFTGPKGGPLRRSTYYAAWHKAKELVPGSEGLKGHDLRHAGGTLAARAGATTKETMRRLGHSTERAALRYQHAATSRDKEVADRIGDFFAAASDASQRSSPCPRSRKAATTDHAAVNSD